MAIDWISVANVANTILEVVIVAGLVMLGALTAWFYGLDAYRWYHTDRHDRHVERSTHPTKVVRLVPRQRIFDWATDDDAGGAA